jgi:hypothetical protein
MSNSKSDWVNVNEPFSVFNARDGIGEYLETGMYIHTKNSHGEDSYYLVGDVNNENGVCDDCKGISGCLTVVRYKMIELPKD